MENKTDLSPVLLNSTQKEQIKDVVNGRISLFIDAFEGRENQLYCSEMLSVLMDIKNNPNISEKISVWTEYKNKNVVEWKSDNSKDILEALDNISDFVLKNDKNEFAINMFSRHHSYLEDDMKPVVIDYLSNFTSNQIRDKLKAIQDDLKEARLKELLAKLEEKEVNIQIMLEEITDKEKSIKEMCLQIANNQKESNLIDSNMVPSNSPRFQLLKENPPGNNSIQK